MRDINFRGPHGQEEIFVGVEHEARVSFYLIIRCDDESPFLIFRAFVNRSLLAKLAKLPAMQNG